MNVLDYERRVKTYASPENKGFINCAQLMEAFNDTEIFSYLANKNSMKTKFLLSPFVANFPIGINLDQSVDCPQRVKRYTTRTKGQIKYMKDLHLSSSIVETFFEKIAEIEAGKYAEHNELDPECNWISINALVLIGCINCEGRDYEKAQVFYRVVQPAMLPRIFVTNQDIRMALFFVTNLSTILHYMSKKVSKEGSADKS